MVSDAPVVLRSGVRDEHPGFGHLLTPSTGAHARLAVGHWACDNDCFNEFNPRSYLRMLDEVRGVSGCLFVACPDVLGDWHGTLELFRTWQPIVSSHKLPVAIVLQDGLTPATVPWGLIHAVFIGGTTEFKLSSLVASVSGYARAYGKWVHMGRVNSRRRFNYAWSIGCQSIDGSSFSWFPDTYEKHLATWASQGRLSFG